MEMRLGASSSELDVKLQRHLLQRIASTSKDGH